MKIKKHKPALMSLLLVLMLLAGCATKDKDGDVETLVDYERTTPAREGGLEVPPDLTRGASVGATSSVTSAKNVAAAEVAKVTPQFKNIRIVRAGQSRYLEVDGAPVKVWPRVRDFWVTRNVPLAIDEPLIGIVETDWIENRARYKTRLERVTKGLLSGLAGGPEALDKYRFRLEAGARAGLSEVYVTHRGLQRVIVEQKSANPDDRYSKSRQTPTAPNVEYEIEIMRLLAIHLGGDEHKVTAMVKELTGQQADDPVALHKDDDGVPYISLQDGYASAWRRAGLALDRTGLTVQNSDEERGIYRVELVPSKLNTKAGKRRAKKRRKKKDNEAEQTLAIDARLSNESDGIRLRLYEEGGVVLLSKIDSKLKVKVKELYQLLYQQLL